MKFSYKKIYIILLLLILIQSKVLARDNKALYTKENISNYLFGIISVKHDNNEAHKYLKKVQLLKNDHSTFNIQFVRNLVLIEQFDEALTFSKSVWKEDELFFEADLLLGLDYFKKGDYENSEKYFERLNKISAYNLHFYDFIGNVLVAWSKASQNNINQSFDIIEEIPKTYRHLKKIQKVFLKCYFDMDDTEIFFKEIIHNEDYNFSRYNFFLANYLLFKNKEKKAVKIIQDSRQNNHSNLLLEESEFFLKKRKSKKIKSFFNCKKPSHNLAEFFYVIANLYASEESYRLSNFYLKISEFLNDNFLPNKALLAENFYYQKKYNLSKKVYEEIKPIGPTYSWYASKSISSILLKEKGKEFSVKNLEKEFNFIKNPNTTHYYQLANFYKENQYYEKAVQYYSLALKKINYDHFLVPKILDRRGTSYERMGDWENSEKDLIESLKLKPDQAHVMNYLAYSWIDKGINLDKGLEMLIEANSIEGGDGYIVDSLGWAYFAKKDYVKAEKFLQRAVELLPTDPIINDHYGDNLWMLKKHIQARHVWTSILKLKATQPKLKEEIEKKLIFGITNKI